MRKPNWVSRFIFAVVLFFFLVCLPECTRRNMNGDFHAVSVSSIDLNYSAEKCFTIHLAWIYRWNL